MDFGMVTGRGFGIWFDVSAGTLPVMVKVSAIVL